MTTAPADREAASVLGTLPQLQAPVLAPRVAAPAVPAQHRLEGGTPSAPFSGRPMPQSTLDAFARDSLQPTTMGGPANQRQLPPVRRPRKRRGSKLFGAFKLLFVVGLLAGGVYVHQQNVAAHRVPRYPQAWDPRVQPFVSFVENERGLPFDHPIFVDFLTEDDYVALFDVPMTADLSTEEQDIVDDYSSLFNAQGLAVGYDPLQGQSTVQSVSTLGFYSREDERIRVRGAELTPNVRVTLVHELTHALQDQQFDLTPLGGERDLTMRALVEADARRIENVYLATLTAEEQAQANAGSTMSDETAAVLDTVPAAVTEQQFAPYVLGPHLLDSVFDGRGNPGVDTLLETPPPEMVLLDPSLLDASVTEVPVPVNAPAGATELEPSRRLGPFEMLVILDTWLPWDMARGAIDDWAGGGYLSFRSAEGAVCFSATATFTRSSDRMMTALTWWAGASGSTAVPSSTGTSASITACDRGATAPAPPEQAVGASEELVFEHETVNLLVTHAVESGDQRAVTDIRYAARCAVRHVLSNPATVALLTRQDELTPEEDALISSVTTEGLSTCPVSDTIGRATVTP